MKTWEKVSNITKKVMVNLYIIKSTLKTEKRFNTKEKYIKIFLYTNNIV